MPSILRLLRFFLFLSCLIGLLPGEGFAQEFRLDFKDKPLPEALITYHDITGVDVVYSPQLAVPYRTSCNYTGNSVYDALICVVSGLPFRVQEVGRNQYVLIPLDSPLDSKGTQQIVLNGFVSDLKSGETLIGAHVLLPDIGAGTTTNDAGFFAFSGIPNKPTRIIISYIGFERMDTTAVMGRRPLALALQPGTEFLDGVTIERDARVNSNLNATPGLISLSPRQLSALPASLGDNDVLEALRWLPGIERAGEATGGFLVRGSGPDQNLYLIDGAPVYHPWHAFSIISTFQTETFKDIAFYKGAFPAEYGGRLSAVLDAEMRDGARTEPRAIVGLSALNANFLIESPVSSNTSFMLSGRRSYIDKLIGKDHPVEDASGRRDTLRTGYYFFDWSAKLSHRPDPRSHFTLSYYSGSDVLDLKLPFDLSIDFASWLQPADLFFEVDQHWGNRIISGRYQRLLSNRLFVTNTIFRSTYQAAENTFIRPTQSAFVSSDYSVSIEDLGAQIDVDYYPSINHQIRAGFSAVNHQFDSSIDAIVAYSPTLVEPLVESSFSQSVELAAYIQDQWRPSPNWTVLPGLRLSYFGHGNHVRASPRLSAQYIVDPTLLTIRGSVASQMQYIQRIRDRHSLLYDLVSSRWVPTDSNTQPSRSGQATIGIESHLIPALVLRADVFARGSRGILLPKDEFQSKDGLLGPGIEIATLLGQHTAGNERSYGIEVGLDAAWRSWNMLASYSGLQAESRATGLNESTYKPTRFETPRSFSLVTSRVKEKWTLGFSVIWRSGYPLTVPVSRYQLSDPITGDRTWYFHNPEINNGRLPAYFRFDINMKYAFRWAHADFSVGLSLYNVLNRRNVIGRSFDPADERFAPNDRLGLPILPLFDIKMSI